MAMLLRFRGRGLRRGEVGMGAKLGGTLGRRGVAGGREDDGWRPWLLQTELGDERWGGGEGQGRGRVSGKVLGVSVARVRTKGGLQREAGGGRLRGARVCSLLPTGRRKTTSEEVSGLGCTAGPATVAGRAGRLR